MVEKRETALKQLETQRCIKYGTWAQSLWNDTEVFEKALKETEGRAAAYIKDMSDEQWMYVVKNYPYAMCFISMHKEKEGMPEDAARELLGQRPELFYCVPSKYLTEEDIIHAIERDPTVYNQVPGELQTENVLEAALKKSPRLIFSLDKKYQTEERMVNGLKEYPLYLCDLPDATDKMKLAALSSDVWVFRYIKNPTREMMLIAVGRSGEMLQYVPVEQRDDEMCITAFRSGWTACYQFMPHLLERTELMEEMKKYLLESGDICGGLPLSMYTKEICEFAIEKEPLSVVCIPEEMRTHELVMNALQKNGLVLEYITPQTPEWVKIAVEQNPLAIRCINLKNDEICRWIADAIKKA